MTQVRRGLARMVLAALAVVAALAPGWEVAPVLAVDQCLPTFTQPLGSPVAVGSGTNSVVVGSFNGDGVADLAVGGPGGVAIFLGNGTGGFAQAPGSPIAVGSVSTMVVGSLNGDGPVDLAVVVSNGVTSLLGNGDGTFTQAPGPPVSVPFDANSVAVGNFNADGFADVVVPARNINSVELLLGNGNGTFTRAPSPIAMVFGAFSAAAGSFNADGFADLAVGGSGGATILLGNGDGTFTNASFAAIGSGNAVTSVVVGSFNGDGTADLAMASSDADTVTIQLGNGNGAFTEAAGSPIRVGDAPGWVAVSTFNGDNLADLAVTNILSGTVTILLGNGNGTFTQPPGSPVTVGTGPRSVAAGDFDGDGFADLAVIFPSSSNMSILLNSCSVADLGVSVTDNPDPVRSDADLIYTITARNEGPELAANVTLSDPLPTGTTFVGLVPPAGWGCTTPAVGASGTVTCTAPSFAVGSATFTLAVHVGAGAPPGNTIRNVVSIDSTSVIDRSGANNNASTDTQVHSAACTPRTRVGIQTVRTGDGRLRVTVSAASNAGFANALRTLTWTRLDNATVEVVGIGSAVQGQRTDLPEGTQTATLLVGRSTPGQASTASFVVTDACGDWPTFVGGGPSAF